jgi:ATP-dependent DNA ligase
VHCAFDLIELDGEVLRLISIETRKRTLASLLRGTNEFTDCDLPEGRLIDLRRQ